MNFKTRRFFYKFHCAFIARRAWFVDMRGDIHEVRVYKREGDLVTCHGGIGFTYKGWQSMNRYSVFYSYAKAQKRSFLETIDRLTNENMKLRQLLRHHDIRYWGNPNGKN